MSKKTAKTRMTLGERLEAVSRLTEIPAEEMLPWRLYTAFPSIAISSCGISFHQDGDFYDRKEAILLLEELLQELRTSNA